MSSVRPNDLTTYSSPRLRYPINPIFSSGTGFALTKSFAMDQIFCFAPSISPPIDPVVSRTKQTSMRGFFGAGLFPFSAPSTEEPARPRRVRRIVMFFIIWFWYSFSLLVGDFVNGVVQREQDVGTKSHPGRSLRMFLEKI